MKERDLDQEKSLLPEELRDAFQKAVEAKVQMGHPFKDTNLGLTSADDEKRLDERGRPVVYGKPWSEVPTGLFLVVFLSEARSKPDGLFWGARCPVDSHHLSVGVTCGRPRFDAPGSGSCLEIPGDLGDDPLKQQYVTEWLAHTLAESILLQKRYVRNGKQLCYWAAATANQAISQAHL